MDFDFVPLHQVVAEIAPNVTRHYYEMTEGDDYGPPDIDWGAYAHASHLGLCRVVTARDNGKLVGYAVFSLGRNPRYKNRIEASGDGIFLEKEYRGQCSAQLIKRADQYLQNLGIQETNYTLSDDRIGRLLGRIGYQSQLPTTRRVKTSSPRKTLNPS
jgi:GNAT superfamily N-acetyltransferase